MNDYESSANLQLLAVSLDEEFRRLDRDYGLNFARRAVILRQIEEDELWAYLLHPVSGKPYRNFGQWLISSAPYSERDCRYALSAIKELKDIPESDFKQMPRESIEVMKLIPESLREDYIEPAKTLKPDQFFQKIDQEHPDLHLERRKPVTIKPDESQGEKIQTALRMAQLRGATSKTQAWEMVAEAAMEWWEVLERMEHEGFGLEGQTPNTSDTGDAESRLRNAIWVDLRPNQKPN